MIILVSLIYFIVIFPIFFNFSINVTANEKEAIFNGYLYGIIPIIFGKVNLISNGINIYINKKNVYLPYKNLINFRKKFKPLKDYHLISFKCNLDVGFKNDLIKSLKLTFIFNYIVDKVKWFFYHKKPYLNIKNKVNVYEKENFVNLYLNGTIALNLLMIIISVIKIIMEKLIYAISRKKQQNKSNNKRFA